MLQLQDIFLTIVHIVLIGFNLSGWIWPQTRKAHLVCVIITAASWFILGIWFGIGYCPITDWQWSVKEKLGETNLPASFIKYYSDKLSGHNVSRSLVDTLTVLLFFCAAILSVYFNFRRKNKNANNH